MPPRCIYMRASERAPVRALNKITLKPDCLWLGNGREKVTEKEREWGAAVPAEFGYRFVY